MKKIILALALTCAIALPIAAMAQAPSGGMSLESIIEGIKNAVWMIFTAIAVIAIVIAGILFLTSAGNPEKIAQARSALIWGVAGVVVGIAAFSIISIVQSVVG